MALWNLWTYRDAFMRIEANRADTSVSAKRTENLIIRLLQEAEEELMSRMGLQAKGGDASSVGDPLNLVSGTHSYSIPVEIFDQAVTRVDVMDAAGVYTTLDRITARQAVVRFNMDSPADTPDTGWPSAYSFDRNAKTLRLYPTPNVSVTSGLILVANVRDNSLSRIYRPTDVTMACTYDSATATWTGTPTTGATLATDDFGVIPTTQSDGSVVSNQSPRSWYRINTVGAATLTLETVFKELTVSGASYITASVSQIELLAPGVMRDGVARWAMALYEENEHPERALLLKAEVLQRIDEWANGSGQENETHQTQGRVGTRTNYFIT